MLFFQISLLAFLRCVVISNPIPGGFLGPGRMAAYRIACKRNKSVQDTQMKSGINVDPAAEVHSLLTLQNHVLERIFVRLHLTDLARCCQVSKTLQSLVQQEGVWQFLCADAFPNFRTAGGLIQLPFQKAITRFTLRSKQQSRFHRPPQVHRRTGV